MKLIEYQKILDMNHKNDMSNIFSNLLQSMKDEIDLLKTNNANRRLIDIEPDEIERTWISEHGELTLRIEDGYIEGEYQFDSTGFIGELSGYINKNMYK